MKRHWGQCFAGGTSKSFVKSAHPLGVIVKGWEQVLQVVGCIVFNSLYRL